MTLLCLKPCHFKLQGRLKRYRLKLNELSNFQDLHKLKVKKHSETGQSLDIQMKATKFVVPVNSHYLLISDMLTLKWKMNSLCLRKKFLRDFKTEK